MSDQACDCCSLNRSGTDGASEPESGPPVDRWIGDESVMEQPLPDDVRTAMGRFFGVTSITTLEDWVAEIRRQTGDSEPIRKEDLCHADGRTTHWAELDGTRYDFRCFYDAVVLAELASRPVDIHTTSPNGTDIEARATGDGKLTATPSSAVVSFGIATDESFSPDKPTLEDAYAAICPSVNAFPTRDAYEQWAAQTPAATVGMPLSAGIDVATGLVGD